MSGSDRPGPAATPGYAAADFAVLRAALVPHGRMANGGTDTRAAEDPERLGELTRAFRDDPALAAALDLASPALARTLAAPAPEQARDQRRMTIALTGYLLRSRHRTTPFGLFAGTALVPVEPVASGGIGTGHDLRLRPSPGWLAGLVADIEADPGLSAVAPRVRIAAAPSLRRAGAWNVLADRRAGEPGQWHAEKLVRRSALLDAVLAITDPERGTNGGIGYAALLGLLCAAAPALDRDELARYVAGLLTQRLLVTDLLPPPGETDPLGHLADRLGGHPLARPLRTLRRDLRRAPRSPAATDIRRLRTGLRAVRRHGAGLTGDALLDTDLRLPGPVVREVEHAASVAWSCASARPARPLDGLHHAILDRYGSGCPVPLAELLSLTESLGLRGTPGPAPEPDAPRAARGRLLTGLALDALAAGRTELLLDRTVRRELATAAGGSPADGPPPAVDIFASVVTASAEALDRGDFLVVLGSRGGPAGSAAGRLAGHLGSGARHLAAGPGQPADVALEQSVPAPLDVELVLRPPDSAAADLAGATGWTAFRIDLTGAPGRRPGADISLADLSVIATPARLRLRCERLGADIRPVSFSALHPRRADAVARLLLALGGHGTREWQAWDWGAADALPWLPRVRVGRAVLAPARWAMPPGLLHHAATGTERQWRQELMRWRDAEQIPGVVFAGAWDRKLPLELADPVHAALLRRECRDRGVVTVTEPPGGLAAWRAANWPRGPGGAHAAEFVIPLHPRTSRRPRTVAAPGTGRDAEPAARPRDPAPASVFLPGGSWLCASLTVPAALQGIVLGELTDRALSEAAQAAEVDRWFYARIPGPDGAPRIKLRFHGRADGLNQVLLPAVHAWSGQLRAAGLLREFSLVSYWPETWRYGGSGCMDAAEDFFCCDSRLCAESLAAAPGAVRAEQLAAPGVLRILEFMLGSPVPFRELPRIPMPEAERRLLACLRPAVRASGPGAYRDGRAAPAEECGRSVAVWLRRRQGRSAERDWQAALAAYKSRLADAGRDPAPVAWSLVHMHCNRLAGPGRPAERVAVALARDLMLARSAQVW